MIYTCLIQDTNHRYAQIAISKMFHRNRLDEDANGIYSLKSNQDFRDVFKVGTQSIVYADTSSHRSDGLDMVLGIEATRTLQFKCNYSTGTCAPVQAHLDTVNNFEISEVYFNQFYDAQVDWESFIVNNKKYPSDSKIAWVTIKFRCKLFDSMLPFDSIVFDNGVFSGVFLDRQ
ncbi:MAG: hypothetical protein IPP77_00765 [Bacteroidetes bacterium]|nr:hypothetical protein [Bacteroidota bacterium]